MMRQQSMLALVGGAGEKPRSPNDPLEAAGLAAYRNRGFTDEELAELIVAPVGELAALYFDLLESDDDFDCRSRRSREIAGVVRKRGISQQALSQATLEGIRS